MLSREQALEVFHRHSQGADVVIIEGVMGLFDGKDGKTEHGSTAEMSKWLGVPVLLVLDCYSLARSAAAMIRGYRVRHTGRLTGIASVASDNIIYIQECSIG